MFRIIAFVGRRAAWTAALLMLAATPAAAAAGGGGGGHGGGYHGGGGYYHGGGGYYRGGYGGYYPGFGLGVGIYSGGYGYGYPAHDYGAPAYVDGGSPVALQRSSLYPSDADVQGPPPDADANAATVAVRVPADAEVWFDGAPTSQRGESRTFSSPPLNADRDYHYDIRARWTEGGKEVEQTRRVNVRAGQRSAVDFTRPEPVGAPSK